MRGLGAMGVPAVLVVDMVVIVMFRMRVSGHMLVNDSCVRGGIVVMMMSAASSIPIVVALAAGPRDSRTYPPSFESAATVELPPASTPTQITLVNFSSGGRAPPGDRGWAGGARCCVGHAPCAHPALRSLPLRSLPRFRRSANSASAPVQHRPLPAGEMGDGRDGSARRVWREGVARASARGFGGTGWFGRAGRA